jgi:hypothetical protein
MGRIKEPWGFKATIVSVALLLAGIAYAGKEVIFFTATGKPTREELVKIQQLNELTKPPITKITVMRKDLTTNHRRTADYVAGTIPNAYRDGGLQDAALLIPVINPASPPTVAIPGGGLYTITAPDAKVVDTN